MQSPTSFGTQAHTAPGRAHRFKVQATRCPDTIARLLEEFCKRSYMPDYWHVDPDPSAQDRMIVDIQLSGASCDEARKLAAAMRRHQNVETVFAMDAQELKQTG